jgi:hypothetical protein
VAALQTVETGARQLPLPRHGRSAQRGREFHAAPKQLLTALLALAVEWVQPKQAMPMHFATYPILAGTSAQFRAALDARGLGNRMIEMKPGEDRTF